MTGSDIKEEEIKHTKLGGGDGGGSSVISVTEVEFGDGEEMNEEGERWKENFQRDFGDFGMN